MNIKILLPKEKKKHFIFHSVVIKKWLYFTLFWEILAIINNFIFNYSQLQIKMDCIYFHNTSGVIVNDSWSTLFH